MKTILDNFARHIQSNNGPAMAQQMTSLAQATKQGIISPFELKQLKLALYIMTREVN